MSSTDMSSLRKAQPYVVFELVFDLLLEQAKQETESIPFSIVYIPNDSLVMRCEPVDYAKLGNRFHLVGNLCQIDRRSRVKFKLVFHPFEMAFSRMKYEVGFWRIVWICPTVDHFLLYTGEYTMSLPPIVAHLDVPHPMQCAVTHSIQRVGLFVTKLFDDYIYRSQFEVILELPSLKEVVISIIPKRARHDHAADLTIDAMLFPELAAWEQKYHETMKPVWAKLKQKGIKVLGCEPGAEKGDILELIHTENGSVRMRFMDPVCNCYNVAYRLLMLVKEAANGGAHYIGKQQH
ncbi:hypothetical protein CORC01_00367 [Colletotrichum orchidophilum]|uniref:Uncharacterized protein n=1 Tax=Colletotrichum orchidophilum TaxID=1209926 RepID=A0A1G4BT47_9PEZI|nr:uncharacterized protein CORC01_00367 [Colletotrichum orchidophilum]OHF04515.1 hypothetical protein CORC01_00367 [Colletotrichum orchidophilum]